MSNSKGVSEAPVEYLLDDDDAPELTAERAVRLRPARDVLPEYVLAQFKRSPGRPRSPSAKKQVTLRLDAEILDYFRAGGDGWQSRINRALRQAAGFTD
ncbi:MAG: BrnA antitoxin family protein [Brevundimonas sp.]|nr:BrnA antitoxin family protein [Brevundimonas sp.]